MRGFVAVSIGILFGALFSSQLLAEKNSPAGTWKLNVAKSKFTPGPGPKSATLTIEVQGDSVKTSYEEIEPDDSRIAYEYTATFDDGKDYPITGSGRPDVLSGAETVSLRRSGSNSFGAQFKKSGQVVMTNKTVVSKDGKALAITANGADAKGQPTTLATVWDKQ
jgi:hypothetical protein